MSLPFRDKGTQKGYSRRLISDKTERDRQEKVRHLQQKCRPFLAKRQLPLQTLPIIDLPQKAFERLPQLLTSYFLPNENYFSSAQKFIFFRTEIYFPPHKNYFSSERKLFFFRTEIYFLPHENLFPSARKFISFRTKIYSLPNETKDPHIIIGIGSCQLLDY